MLKIIAFLFEYVLNSNIFYLGEIKNSTIFIFGKGNKVS